MGFFEYRYVAQPQRGPRGVAEGVAAAGVCTSCRSPQTSGGKPFSFITNWVSSSTACWRTVATSATLPGRWAL